MISSTFLNRILQSVKNNYYSDLFRKDRWNYLLVEYLSVKKAEIICFFYLHFYLHLQIFFF